MNRLDYIKQHDTVTICDYCGEGYLPMSSNISCPLCGYGDEEETYYCDDGIIEDDYYTDDELLRLTEVDTTSIE